MTWINLPCQPHDCLDWTQELTLAHALVEREEKILWKLDVGLENSVYPFDCELTFQAASFAMHRFTEYVWPLFQNSTESVCLYQGSAPKSCLAADELANYLQMLSHKLPDEATILLLFDLSEIQSPLLALQIISKDRFSHFCVALRGMDLPLEGLFWEQKELRWHSLETRAGFVFPTAHIHDFEVPKEGVKILFENFLSEEWAGLDLLYIVRDSLTSQAMRKIQGFVAAGGEVREISRDDIQKADSG